ncbi:MAG: hypothetical protein HZB91_05345 [Elusimicrobia bacterium]|nr:hypothetical protein [Elusimicrobiota bacterium]
MCPLKARLRLLLEDKDISGLRHAISSSGTEELAALFPGLAPMEKLACFKLMKYETAVAMFQRLSFSERYFLLCGFPLQSIAPLLSGLDGWQRTLFHESPPVLFDRLLDEMREPCPQSSQDAGRPKAGRPRQPCPQSSQDAGRPKAGRPRQPCPQSSQDAGRPKAGRPRQKVPS